MWQLIALSSQNERQVFDLLPGKNIIGRHEDSDIVILDLSVSRSHAEIDYDENEDKLVLTDLASANGTYVNGVYLEAPAYIAPNDELRIGMHLLQLTRLSTGETRLRTEKEIAEETKPRSGVRLALPQNELTRPAGKLMIESAENYAILFDTLNKNLSTINKLEDVLFETAQFLIRIMDADDCVVVLKQDFDKFKKFRIPPSLAERVINEETVAMVTDLTEAKIEDEYKNYTSLLLAPIFNLQQVIGLLFINKTRTHVKQFDRRDMQLAVSASHQLELAIQRNDFQQILRHNETHDLLTELPNRNLLLDHLQQMLAKTPAKGATFFALYLVNIDNFSAVNDSLGHRSGDELLVEFGKRLLKCFDNKADVIARYGGDQFAVLHNALKDEDEIMPIGQKIYDVMSKSFSINDQEMFLTISVGVALSTQDYDQAEEMLRDAGIAMFRAKETSGVNIQTFDDAMHNEVVEILQVQNELRKGSIVDEFELFYQPIMAIQSRKLVGFESLIRWHSPDMGLKMPDDFFSSVDSTGVLHSIDSWALHTACRQMSTWKNKFPQHEKLYIATNISAKMLLSTHLFEEIEMALKENNLKPYNIRLEITERASIGNEERVIDTLNLLKGWGVDVGLDDFGTGYSALSYLHRLPLRFLKIDRSFVSGVGVTNESTKIVQLVLGLASSLGLKVIAEGVENEEQLAFLQGAGCEYMQGFLLSPAVSASDAEAMLIKDKIL